MCLELSRFTFADREDLRQLIAPRVIQKKLRSLEDTFPDVSVGAVMKNLSFVGDIFNVAYAGAKGTVICPKILPILINYQEVLKLTKVYCDRHILDALQALRYHRLALDALRAENATNISFFIRACGKIAKKTSDGSKELGDRAHFLCEQLREALIAATAEQVELCNARKRISDKIAASYEREKLLDSRTASLAKDLKAAREEERKATKRVDQIACRGMLTAVAQGILGFPASAIVHGAADRHANKVHSDYEEALSRIRFELENEGRRIGGELAKTLRLLVGLKGENKNLQRSLHALELAHQALCKLKTIFHQAQIFWAEFQRKTENLSSLSSLQEDLESVDRDLLHQACIESAWGWAVVGNISLEAYCSMKGIDKDFDRVMKRLPSEQESIKLLEAKASAILENFTAS